MSKNSLIYSAISKLIVILRLRDGHIMGTLRNCAERMVATITTTNRESVQIEKFTRLNYMCINANSTKACVHINVYSE